MCFYSVIEYTCGDWKFGNLRSRCPRQHRIGETCGTRLIDTETTWANLKVDKLCPVCRQIIVKRRRCTRLRDSLTHLERIERETSGSPSALKFPGVKEKRTREMLELEREVQRLVASRAAGMSINTAPNRYAC